MVSEKGGKKIKKTTSKGNAVAYKHKIPICFRVL
jgi:hypothetical protein